MGKFILKRLLLMIPTLWIILTIVFVLMRVVPGSPAVGMLQEMGITPTVEEVEKLEDELGLNDPILVQYVRFIKDIVTGNWGTSYYDGNSVIDNILNVMEPTLMMGYTYFIIHMITAIPVGVICAVKRNSLLDYTLTFGSLILMVIPSFCLCLLGIYVFSFKLQWFPAVGYIFIKQGGFWNSLYYVMLPALLSALGGVAGLARHTRSTMLDVLNQDYIRTARAKGLPERMIYYKHALKNTVSVTGSMVIGSFVGAIGGSSVVEKVFNQRGMGRLALDSLTRRDYPQETAIVLLVAFIALGTKLINDIVYKLVDPRIEYE